MDAESKYREALKQKIKDRNQDLQYAANTGEAPGILERLGQYPEDFALGIAENAQGGSGGNLSWPTSSPTNKNLDKAYEEALKRAIQTRQFPSGWSGL